MVNYRQKLNLVRNKWIPHSYCPIRMCLQGYLVTNKLFAEDAMYPLFHTLL